MNQVRLRATPVARSALRYTPAGVAVAELSLRHDGTVVEAGSNRELGFEFAAVALGPVALALDREPLGRPLDIAGFVAPKSRRSSRLVVHITEYSSAEHAHSEYARVEDKSTEHMSTENISTGSIRIEGV